MTRIESRYGAMAPQRILAVPRSLVPGAQFHAGRDGTAGVVAASAEVIYVVVVVASNSIRATSKTAVHVKECVV